MKIDGRKHDHKTLETFRLMGMKRLKEGATVREVAESYGLTTQAVYKWRRLVREKGPAALKSTKGTGRPPELTPSEQVKLAGWLNGTTPTQYGFDFGLWTPRLVCDLVEEKLGKTISIGTASRVLKVMGFTPQKPVKRAYERDEVLVRTWTEKTFPALRRRAKARGADVFFLDESGLRSDCPLARTWAPRGRTPVVPATGKRQKVNVISLVNPLGSFWFKVFQGEMNGQRFIEFVREFVNARNRPVYIVLDGHPAHRGSAAKGYLQSMKGKVEFHFLPPYAPDLNPDEFVWRHLKGTGLSRRPLREGEELFDHVSQDLHAIKNDRALVRSFFRAETVRYTLGKII